MILFGRKDIIIMLLCNKIFADGFSCTKQCSRDQILLIFMIWIAVVFCRGERCHDEYNGGGLYYGAFLALGLDAEAGDFGPAQAVDESVRRNGSYP